jgi:uncharacterized pyridoxamine 5'-phosphate oxidase family protein
MEIASFADIEAEFIRRVHTMVWCSVATVDGQGRPRSRVLHPIWEGSTGWIGTHRSSHKARHLANNPHVSLAYITNIHEPVYVDATAEWVDDLATRQHVWNLFKDAPPPLGYDIAAEFIRPNHEDFGVLKLTPWRIDLVTFPAESFDKGTQVWRPGAGGG